MDSPRELSIWTLTRACQRLAEQAEALSKNRQSFDVEHLQAVGQLVQRATEVLAQGPEAARAKPTGAARRGLSGLLSRVLGGAEPEGAPKSEPSAGVPPTPNHTLALRGHHQMIATPDLVTFLSAQRKSGVLEVVTELELFILEFDNGDIVHAQSNRTPEGQRLGDILVSRGVIDRAALEQVMRSTSGVRVGEQLIAMQLVPREQFVDALRRQIQWLFQRLFEQPSQRFTFWSGAPIHADSNVRLNATALLLDGARAFDEMNWIANIATEQAEASPAAPVPADHADPLDVGRS